MNYSEAYIEYLTVLSKYNETLAERDNVYTNKLLPLEEEANNETDPVKKSQLQEKRAKIHKDEYSPLNKNLSSLIGELAAASTRAKEEEAKHIESMHKHFTNTYHKQSQK